MKCGRALYSLFLIAASSLTAYSQHYSSGKAALGDPVDSVRTALGPSYRFDAHPLSDPAIVITLAYRGNEEAYLLESFNGSIFYIEHAVYSETGFNENDSKATLAAKYGSPSPSGDDLFWRSSLDHGHPCVRYGNNLLPWPGGGVSYLTSLSPRGDCQVSAMYSPLRGRAGQVKQMPAGYVFGIDVKLLDPSIALPEFSRLAAQQQQKQQDVEQKAHQVKAPL